MGMGGVWDESHTHGSFPGASLPLLQSHDVAVKRIVLAAAQCTQETREGVFSLTGEGELEVRACLEELLREYEREMNSQHALCLAAERQHNKRMEGLQQTRSALVDREILHQAMEAKENIQPPQELSGYKGFGAHEAEIERRLCERERAVALREARVKEAFRANEERAQDLEVMQMRLREQGEQQSAASNDLAHRHAKLHAQTVECEERERQLTEGRKEQGLKEQQLSALATRLAEQQELLPQSNAAEEKEQDLSVLEFRLAEREEALAAREASASDLRARLGADEKMLQERETAIFHREAAMVQREGEVDLLVHNAVARERDALSAREAVAAKEAAAAELGVQLGKKERLFQERETAMLHREAAIVQREDEVAQREDEVAQREADMEHLAQQFAGREQVVSDKEHAATARLARIEAAQRELDSEEQALVLRGQAIREREESLHGRELAAKQAASGAEQLQARLIEMERSLEKHGRAQAETDQQLRDRDRRLMKSEDEMSRVQMDREWLQEERERVHLRREETLRMREEVVRLKEEAIRVREERSVGRGDAELLQQRLLEVVSGQHDAGEGTASGIGVRRKRLTARKQIVGACNSPVLGGLHSTPSASSQPGPWTFAAAPSSDSVEDAVSLDAVSMEAAAVAAKISLLGKRGRTHPAGSQLPWAGLATKRLDGGLLQPRSTSL